MEVSIFMKLQFEPKTNIQLDPIGQFYASHINEEYPGNYSISAHLKGEINTQILQQATNDIMRRLPFLQGKLQAGSYWYYHEILANPPQIEPDYAAGDFSEYYTKGAGHVLRVLYGERHFKIETIHSICDGRGLTKIVVALLARYFELLGVSMQKNNTIDCNGSFQLEECEDAFAKFADTKSIKILPQIDAYHHEGSKPARVRVITKKFNLSKIKEASKAYNATVNGYILAHIFQAIAEERNARNSKKPIASFMPIDLRSFFPTQTIRNFVSAATITMPESEKFSDVVKGIQEQFTKIDKDFVQNEINVLQKVIEDIKDLPLSETTSVLKELAQHRSDQVTTTFSNLGLVKLPTELEEYVEMLEFIVGREPDKAYSFGCITIRDTLVLTATINVENDDIVEVLMRRLGKE